MSDSRAIDRESRRQIHEELFENILVEAGAGSGKTQMLAERMAAGVAAGVYQVEHMAAVTFTRKAASELRGRFHLALEGELVRACRSPGHAADPERIARLQFGAVESGALLRWNHSLVLRAAPARAPGRIGRVPGFYRARRGAGSRIAPTRLAGVHHQRARRRRPRHDGVARGRHPPTGSGLRRSRRSATTRTWSFRRGRARARIRSRPGRRWTSSGRSSRSTCPRRSTRKPPARFSRPPATFRGQLRVSRRRIERPAVVASLLATWDRESKITQKWWADSPAGEEASGCADRNPAWRLPHECR